MGSQIFNSPSKSTASTNKTFSYISEAEEGTKWMTRVRISRKWNELDFMKSNEVTSLDVFMLDNNGDELHGVVPKKLIWKFDPLLRIGGIYSLNKFTILDEKKIFRPAHNEHRLFFNWDTQVKYMCGTSVAIPQHKFTFSQFEDLESHSANTYLTDVIGVLISFTNLQDLKRPNGQHCMMRDLTLQNLSGNNVKITLWGEATTELNLNLDTKGIKDTPVVVVVSSTYVRKYQGKYSLSSTNATKVFFNLAIPEVLDMRERSCRITPAREITHPDRNKQPVIDLTMPDNTKTISELLECKWDSTQQALNRIIVKARATKALTAKGWYYLGCNRWTAKVVGEEGDYGCTRCENKVEEPTPRYLLRFEVTDHTGYTLFVALDSEVQRMVHASSSDMVGLGEDQGERRVVASFEELVNVELDYHITLSAYNNKNQPNPSFTVTRLPYIVMPQPAATPSSPNLTTPKVESDTGDNDESPCKRTNLQSTVASKGESQGCRLKLDFSSDVLTRSNVTISVVDLESNVTGSAVLGSAEDLVSNVLGSAVLSSDEEEQEIVGVIAV